MEKFKQVTGVVVPLNRANVDTDAIIPKQFLKSIKRTGFGPYLFDEWRYLDHGEPEMDCSNRPLNTDFVLNQPRYSEGRILLTRANFGCGSSREHAPWALLDYGFRVIISPRFADIFYNNCFKSGILPIVLDETVVNKLFFEVEAVPGYVLTIDLTAQTITAPDKRTIDFEVAPSHKQSLLEGLDDIATTLRLSNDIRVYEEAKRREAPWLFRETL